MLGSHLVLVTLNRGLQLLLSKTIRIGDTKYHFRCSVPMHACKSNTHTHTHDICMVQIKVIQLQNVNKKNHCMGFPDHGPTGYQVMTPHFIKTFQNIIISNIWCFLKSRKGLLPINPTIIKESFLNMLLSFLNWPVKEVDNHVVPLFPSDPGKTATQKQPIHVVFLKEILQIFIKEALRNKERLMYI